MHIKLTTCEPPIYVTREIGERMFAQVLAKKQEPKKIIECVLRKTGCLDVYGWRRYFDLVEKP